MSNARPSLKRVSEGSSWDQLISFDSTPYPLGARSSLGIISSESPFLADSRQWGSSLSTEVIEDDDEQYTPSWRGEKKGITSIASSLSTRGAGNVGCLMLLVAGVLALFIGYPIASFNKKGSQSTLGGFNVGGINATGQVPEVMGNFGLIDSETPHEAYTKTSWADGRTEMQLVFSDEFNTDGRTFYPGDDPYWEAVDLHYWATNNLEWYDPEAVTTKDGSLVITLSQKDTHDLNYEGGMMTTWNKFCFTGGYLEASVQLPGANNILGLWPAIWTMGNLGRAGYGASLEGVWPYTYDSCDVGTVANQTVNGEPLAATINGDASKGGSFHTFLGSVYLAPEIDVFEAQINQDTLISEVSQSAQWAPFNAGYLWNSTADNMIINDPTISSLNTYTGSATQQATSVVTNTNPACYEANGGCYSVYGFEYKPGFDDGYITWIADNKQAWTLKAPGMGPDPNVQISSRPVPQEPMYLLVNLGMSRNFGPVDLADLPFPVHMKVDYIRVYQPTGNINIGCDPKDFPTKDYINQ
ncbi:hypothetical protein D9613_000685 [Agrocybe pediades]|uniref:GH16 domain-containing protein n=1 Tax=Agrocybe pediades TaxID=84607 RepID=A0A8H4VU29_9AGAR|nr:hypothetical protein D9613_000685 [Agrocybe pediades]